ncbi:MAG: hypothetical protein KDC54_00670 [Lewinella sp.]|nr:hypothetical protein [Lewinella sp.]
MASFRLINLIIFPLGSNDFHHGPGPRISQKTNAKRFITNELAVDCLIAEPLLLRKSANWCILPALANAL